MSEEGSDAQGRWRVRKRGEEPQKRSETVEAGILERGGKVDGKRNGLLQTEFYWRWSCWQWQGLGYDHESDDTVGQGKAC